uniref:Uncharacterized protein n=1 Tax=Avena sativa TaxID=4498 RepID=A0ACD5T806_AVESA
MERSSSKNMATTKAMASSLVILLAAILLATASVQARHDSLPTPPAEAPALVRLAGGQCPREGVAELRLCPSILVSYIGGRNTYNGELCCLRIRRKPIADAVACLCANFFFPGFGDDGVDVAAQVNTVLDLCGIARVPDLVCIQGSA